MKRVLLLLPLFAAAAVLTVDAQSAGVTYERILKAASEPQNWITYGGTYMSQRFSGLNQITPSNVANLESKWVVQNQVFGAWQSNPLVVDGVMYITQRPNDILAVDARTGAVYWLRQGARVLRRQQPRRRDPWRHRVHGYARRAPRRCRREDRPAALEHRSW